MQTVQEHTYIVLKEDIQNNTYTLVSTALVAQVLQNNTIYSKNDVTEQ
jgi:hypothetical protein